MRINLSKLKVDWTSVKTAARTSGLLMVGNVFATAMLLGSRALLSLISLLVRGTVLIMLKHRLSNKGMNMDSSIVQILALGLAVLAFGGFASLMSLRQTEREGRKASN